MYTTNAMPSKVWRIVSVVIRRGYYVQNDKKVVFSEIKKQKNP
jgi:hypothetical protein